MREAVYAKSTDLGMIPTLFPPSYGRLLSAETTTLSAKSQQWDFSTCISVHQSNRNVYPLDYLLCQDATLLIIFILPKMPNQPKELAVKLQTFHIWIPVVQDHVTANLS